MSPQTLSLLALTTFALAGAPGALGQMFWINEFHYDDTGTDNGEFVEVVAPADFTDLASVRLTLYNGGDGLPYGSSHHLGTFTAGETVAGFTIYSKQIGGIQNGAPDGFSLDVGGRVQQFISYEGTFSALGGPAAGMPSLDIAFLENDLTAPGSSIGLTGLGRDLSEFVWRNTLHDSPGLVNVDQEFAAVVPEPGELGLVAGLVLVGFAAWRSRRSPRAMRQQSTPPAV